jgi:hypothetical protein
MSDKKTISINPDLFKIQSSKKTRKNNAVAKPIKVKSSVTPHNKTTRHRLLNQLRQQQEENYKKMLNGGTQSEGVSIVDLMPETDLKSSIDYFSNLNEKLKNTNAIPSTPKNYTMKAWHNSSNFVGGSTSLNSTSLGSTSLNSTSPLTNLTPSYQPPVANVIPDHEQVALGGFPVDTDPIPITESPVLPPLKYEPPKYGCLKGGSLPTYRQMMNQTRKNTTDLKPSKPLTLREKTEEFKKIFQKNKEAAKMEETMKQAKKYVKKNPKQKKILRRTYHVGKSKYYPKVGVLVSNKTLRKQITEKSYRLKQTPIDEVRKTLVKKGLIKIGSTCPNDVLRQMYESVNMMCGDLNNHNPENLLYNYFNDTIR